MAGAEIEQRKLAAIMFTDMVGYSALSQRNDKLAQELAPTELKNIPIRNDPGFQQLLTMKERVGP